MTRASTLALLIVVLTASSSRAQSNDDAAVFDAALGRFSADFERSRKVAPRFLVFDETTVVLPQDLGFVARRLPNDLVEALLASSVSHSIGSYSPPSPFRLSSAAILGPVLEAAPPGSARPHYYRWDLLRARFPEVAGILEFASPAYSPDHTSALVYFWTGCGSQCATGHVYMLEQSGGHWRVARTYSPWIE